MIKNSNAKNFTITVKLKNGELFENKDITASPILQGVD